LASSEKQIPQVIEKFESEDKGKEALERAAMRPRQIRCCPTFAAQYKIYPKCVHGC
jgi:hypothetical protein